MNKCQGNRSWKNLFREQTMRNGWARFNFWEKKKSTKLQEKQKEYQDPKKQEVAPAEGAAIQKLRGTPEPLQGKGALLGLQREILGKAMETEFLQGLKGEKGNQENKDGAPE